MENKKALGDIFDEMFADAQEYIPDPKDIVEGEFDVLDEEDGSGEDVLENIDCTDIPPATKKALVVLLGGVPGDDDCLEAASEVNKVFEKEGILVRVYYWGEYVDHQDDDTSYQRMLFCNLPDEISEPMDLFKSIFWEKLEDFLDPGFNASVTCFIDEPKDVEELN